MGYDVKVMRSKMIVTWFAVETVMTWFGFEAVVIQFAIEMTGLEVDLSL